MVYALYSEGFRLGGSNSQRAANTGLVPLNYGADKLGNYEVGLKSEWLDNRLQINVSAFFMEWTDIQMDNDGGVDNEWWLRGTINGDTAETKGVEVNWVAQITDNLNFEGSLFFADPEFSSDYELIGGEVVTKGNGDARISGLQVLARIRILPCGTSRIWVISGSVLTPATRQRFTTT